MASMKIRIPRSSHPSTRLTITTPLGVSHATFDDRHHWFEYQLPDGVREHQVTIIAEFIDARYMVDSRMKPVVVCEAKPEAKPVMDPGIDMATVNRSLADFEAGRCRPIEDVIDDFRFGAQSPSEPEPVVLAPQSRRRKTQETIPDDF
jgi:hypothetical protein